MATMRRHTEFRPLDFIYDPVYITTDKNDYTATASYGLSCVSQYAVQPQYNTMFTDNEKYARNLVVFRATILPNHVDVSWSAKKQQMAKNRKPSLQVKTAACQYFVRPNVADLNPFVNSIHVTSSPTKTNSPGEYESQNVKTSVPQKKKTPKRVRRAVQTDYRESEAQTYPWAPPNPQGLENMPPEIITTLNFEQWEQGFPVTQNELDIIERTRLRRACERVLNSTAVDLSTKHHVIREMEIYEWIQREDEIHRMFELRERLSRSQTQLFTHLNQVRMHRRLDEVTKRTTAEKEKKINQIEKRKDRELRKLIARTNAARQTNVDISENQVVRPSCKQKAKSDSWITPLQSQKLMRQMDPGVPLETEDIQECTKAKPMSMCQANKKWKCPEVERMYEMLTKKWKGFLRNKEREELVELTPESKESDQLKAQEEVTYNHAALLQKLIRGRHWQLQVQEGIAKAKPLMDAMKETKVLTKEDVREFEEKKQISVEKRRVEDEEMRYNQYLDSAQEELQGNTISALLDFLSKELARLQDERRCHALSLLAETHREEREAKEKGRRQQMLQRRREFNEMFKQMAKIKQDTVDSYLESILLDSVQCVAQDRAREYIVEKAKAIDLQAQDETEDPLAEEAIVQDLLYNCVIPNAVNIQQRFAEQDHIQGGTRGIADLIHLKEAEMPLEATSGPIYPEEVENEMDELNADVDVTRVAESVGKKMFEILLENTHRIIDNVTKEIIEEIIRTLLTKPGAMDHPSRSTFGDSWSPSDFKVDLFKAIDLCGSALSFTEEGQIQYSEENSSINSNKKIESDSEISQEFDTDRQ